MSKIESTYGPFGGRYVAEAVARVRPYCVDVASGVESAPGKKDAARVREFVRAAKAAAPGRLA